MNTFELNKVVGAVLFAGLTAMTAWLISLAAYGQFEHGEHERVIHYEVAGLEQDDAMHDEDAMADEPEEPAIPLAQLLAEADIAKGQRTFKKCAACHTVDEGGKNKIGPNLWSIVNRTIASHEGFTYSDAMAALEGAWDFERLNQFTADPKGTVPGTKMAFKGVSKDGDRANVLAYLRSLSAEPAELPAE